MDMSPASASPTPLRVRLGVLGLGEAGSIFAGDLAARLVEVRGYDPVDVGEIPGVTRRASPAEAVADADVVIGLTHAVQAMEAATDTMPHMRRGAFYADFSTSDPGRKRELAALAHEHGLRFVDGAIMNPVPLRRAATAVDLAGDDAAELADLLNPAGMNLVAVSDEPGVAATRKLLRSVLVKGVSALVIESMRAAEAAGMADWFREHVFEQLCGIDREFVVRLVRGNLRHSERRIHEMDAASTLLEQLGEQPLTSRATRQVLASVPERGVPDLTVGEQPS